MFFDHHATRPLKLQHPLLISIVLLSVINGNLSTKLYYKHGDFDLRVVNLPYIYSNIPVYVFTKLLTNNFVGHSFRIKWLGSDF